MTAPTDDRPADTIRAAFEAMLTFLEALLTGILRGSADPTHTLATNAADAIGSVMRKDPHLLAFRDLIQRAAEEHNRRAAVGGDFTPERIREARERCERATPGPWVHSPPGVDEPHVSTKIGSDSDRVDWIASPRSAPSKRWHDAAFIAHAREDLPAALAEIERLQEIEGANILNRNALKWALEREEKLKKDMRQSERDMQAEIERLGVELDVRAAEIEALRANLQSVLDSACRRAEELARERDSKAAEIERLTGRVQHARDAANRLYQAARAMLAAEGTAGVGDRICLAVNRRDLDSLRAAIDPAEQAAALAEVQRRDGLEREIERLTAELATAEGAAMVAAKALCEWQGRALAAEAELAARTPADASLEARAALRDTFSKLVHIDHMARHLCENSGIDHTKDPPEATVDVADLTALGGALDAIDPTEEHDEGQRDRLMAVLDAVDASRPGLTEEQAADLRERAAFIAETCSGGDHTISNRDLIARRIRELPLRASRGETGPAPTGLTSAMHAAQQRRSVPPASAFGEWPDEPRGGLTCPGCYDATGIAQPHDPRATLHAGDPASPFAPGSLAAGSATEDRILDRKRGGK